MRKPLIGITAFSMQVPGIHPSLGPSLRSAVNQQYIDAVVVGGGAPLAIPIGLDADALASIYETLDGLLLPGGDDVAPHHYGQAPHPKLRSVDDARDELELTLAGWALQDDLPILGICRGIQLLAVAGGGTLYQDLPSQYEAGVPHDVRDFGRDHQCHGLQVEPGSHLAAALGTTAFRVNSFHHQAVLEVPTGFTVTARADDGVIEAIEEPSHRFVVGIQCHPEGMWQTTAPEFVALFKAFVDAAQDRHLDLAS